MERRHTGLHEVLIQEVNYTSYSWGYQVTNYSFTLSYKVTFCELYLNLACYLNEGRIARGEAINLHR